MRDRDILFRCSCCGVPLEPSEEDFELHCPRGCTLYEKCGETFESWDKFQRHSCAMSALRELQEMRRDTRRSKTRVETQARIR